MCAQWRRTGIERNIGVELPARQAQVQAVPVVRVRALEQIRSDELRLAPVRVVRGELGVEDGGGVQVEVLDLGQGCDVGVLAEERPADGRADVHGVRHDPRLARLQAESLTRRSPPALEPEPPKFREHRGPPRPIAERRPGRCPDTGPRPRKSTCTTRREWTANAPIVASVGVRTGEYDGRTGFVLECPTRPPPR